MITLIVELKLFIFHFELCNNIVLIFTLHACLYYTILHVKFSWPFGTDLSFACMYSYLVIS